MYVYRKNKTRTHGRCNRNYASPNTRMFYSRKTSFARIIRELPSRLALLVVHGELPVAAAAVLLDSSDWLGIAVL